MHILHIAMLFQREGHTVELFMPSNGPLRKLAAEADIPTHVDPLLYSNDADSSVLEPGVTSHNPDFIVVSTLLGARIIQLLHTERPDAENIIWIIQESECHEIMRNNPYITPDTFALVSAIVFVSDYTKKVYTQWNTGNMHMIHNGIDIDGIQQKMQQYNTASLRQQFGISDTALVSTLIGSICPRKGQKEFILAALETLEKLPRDCNAHFLIAGKLHPEYAQYFEEALKPAKDSGMIDRFHVLPEQKDPFEYYACSDIYVCNSFIESFPLVILEAMACGLPIAASNCYGIAEQIIHNESGLLHLSGNSSQLAGNLYTLLTNKELRDLLGRNAQKRVSSLFSQERMLENYNNLLTTLT